MLSQYRDCFSEVSRQTRWYRDLREAYQDLRAHAENVKREALLSVNNAQCEVNALKVQLQAQTAQICQLKEQVWVAEQGRRQAECGAENMQKRIAEYLQQIGQLKLQLESLQTQLKEANACIGISEEQEELRQLREFRDKCERAARSLADIEHQDKDCWGGLQWCDSWESENSQKREARLQATLGLLLVEAGRRRRASGRDPVFKDCDSASTDGSTKSREQKQSSGAPCDSQGQLQGVLDENQQLREQLSQLQNRNASLASQFQPQYGDPTRSLSGITCSLDAGGRAESLQQHRDARGGFVHTDKQSARRSAYHHHQQQVRASRASRGSSSGSSSAPQGPQGAAPWDYSDHADLCDSGFWSLQASPPRACSVLAGPSSPARLCWLERPTSPAAPAAPTAPEEPHMTAPGATTFILNARRPRPRRH